MEYRVEALASASGVGVDTIRFYQGRGLLDPPARRGRVAYYGEEHVDRLRRIRDLQGQGFSLAQIRRVLESEAVEATPSLLQALVDARVGTRTWTLEELAAESGVPQVLLRAAVQTGLLEPLQTDDGPRFSDSDLEIAKVGMGLLDAGFPLPALLQEAATHTRNVQATCDAAIELFDEHIRQGRESDGDLASVTDQFQRLLPMVTRLVAMHFQRTLVTRALRRLDSGEEREALEAALRALDEARLEVEVAWR